MLYYVAMEICNFSFDLIRANVPIFTYKAAPSALRSVFVRTH